MKIKLTLMERLIAFQALLDDRKGSMADWKIINQAKGVLGLSDEDYKLYDISQTPL